MRRAGLAAWGAALLTLLCALLVPVGATAMQPPVERATAKKGTLAVTIKTPNGVPGTVVLTSAGRKKVVTKKPGGTSVTVKVKLPPGRWTVAPQRIVTSSAVFSGVASASPVRVRAGKKASVTVTYRAAPTARDLQVTRLEARRFDLSWTAPAAGTQYVVRRAIGSVAPSSASAGVGVPVTGTTASATGLTPATGYAISVFARAKGSSIWGRPVSTTVTTPGAESPAVVVNPSTVLIENPADSTVSLAPEGVVATVPSGTVPTLGQPWVLPPSATLPGGFIGTVSSVAPNGGSVTLTAGGVLDAFDYVEIDVPDISELPVSTLPARSGAAGRSDRVDVDCDDEADATLSLNRDFDPFGSFSATLKKYEGIGPDVPIGMTFSGTFGVVATASVDVNVSAALSCEIELPKLKVTLPAGPVPLALVAEPVVTVGVAGELNVRAAGFSVTLGAEFGGYVGVGDDDVDGDVIAEATPLEPDITTAEASLTVHAGVDVSVGPGVGNPAVGAMVGIAASLNALDGSVTPQGLDCLELKAGGSISGSIETKAWLGDHELERSIAIPGVGGYLDYGGSPWYFPEGCGGPADYRIRSGTLDVSSSWSGGCTDGVGWCGYGAEDYTAARSFNMSSTSHLTVAEAGEWVSQYAGVDAYLNAPMRFTSWSFDAAEAQRLAGNGCTSTIESETTGPVEFGDAYWATAAHVIPAAGEGLTVEHHDNYGSEVPVGEWVDSWVWTIGAWDTDLGNGYPRVPMRHSYESTGADCAGSSFDDNYMLLDYLGPGHFPSQPSQARLTAKNVTVTELEGCTPEACQFQVTGTHSYEYRSSASDFEVQGLDGSGTATVTWSYVIDRRPLGGGTG